MNKVEMTLREVYDEVLLDIPQFCDYIDVLYQLGDDLGLYRYE